MNNNSILALDIGTTKITAIVAQNDLNNRINILGVGNSKSDGIKKGTIVDLDLASTSINEAIKIARQSSATNIESTFISISGANTKSLRSSGGVNIPSGQITHSEINQVLQMALYNAKVIPEYEVIHVLPLYFRVDDADAINNPLNMNGSRLEVYVNIVTAKKTAIVNIQNALKKSDLEVTNFVLNGYASSIAVLKHDQKRLGTAVIDLGGSTSELAIFRNQTIAYNDFIAIGSEHITHDLSIMLHTPYNAANMIKKQYSTLLPPSLNEQGEDTNTSITKVKVQILGNESETKEIPLVQIQPIIHARVEEILCLMKDKIEASGMKDSISGGIILTGGMSQIPGINELASKIFAGTHVKIANPVNIQNGYIDFNSPTMSTIVGLLKYALDADPFFELDSNKNLRKKEDLKRVEINDNATSQSNDNSGATTLEAITLDKDKNKKSFWNKIGEWL